MRTSSEVPSRSLLGVSEKDVQGALRSGFDTDIAVSPAVEAQEVGFAEEQLFLRATPYSLFIPTSSQEKSRSTWHM
jgi:hypothetical protein